MIEAAREARLDEARVIHRHFLDLMEAMFWESNPIPVKQCLALRGEIKPFFRKPLAPPEPPTVSRLVGMLASLDLAVEPFAGDDPERIVRGEGTPRSQR
jgi:4-hydroxy-tetrahydrodipicolinate synthase